MFDKMKPNDNKNKKQSVSRIEIYSKLYKGVNEIF